jgi:hypothetical protein
MNAKEKAKEMYDKMLNSDIMNMTKYCAKQCALIAVDEILNNNCGSHTDEANASNSEIYCDEYFWNNVKSELQSL